MAENQTNPDSGNVKLCPVCGKPGFLGFANQPGVHCADHMPGLSQEERQLYRQAATRS